MSKFRAVLGGLAAIGLFAALGATVTFTASSSTGHTVTAAVAESNATIACYTCISEG